MCNANQTGNRCNPTQALTLSDVTDERETEEVEGKGMIEGREQSSLFFNLLGASFSHHNGSACHALAIHGLDASVSSGLLLSFGSICLFHSVVAVYGSKWENFTTCPPRQTPISVA